MNKYVGGQHAWGAGYASNSYNTGPRPAQSLKYQSRARTAEKPTNRKMRYEQSMAVAAEKNRKRARDAASPDAVARKQKVKAKNVAVVKAIKSQRAREKAYRDRYYGPDFLPDRY